MNAIGIVEAFKNYIGIPNNTNIVLQKVKTPSSIKAYKIYEWILWYISTVGKYQIFTIKDTLRETTDQELESNINKMENELLKRIFNLLGTQEAGAMSNGNFRGIIL